MTPILDVPRIARLHIAILDALSSEPDASAQEMLSALATTLGRFALAVSEHSGEPPGDFIDRFSAALKASVAGADDGVGDPGVHA